MYRSVLFGQSMRQSRLRTALHDAPSVLVQRSRFATEVKASAAAAASKTATAVPPAARSKSFLRMYEEYLERAPVRTKMLTGAFLWGLGDAVAQIVPAVAATRDGDDSCRRSIAPYDWMRTARAVLFGFAIHAPTSHVHFNFLEWMTVRAGIKGLQIPFFKAFMEQFVYWSWISNSMYHGAMGAMQGKSPVEIKDRISDVLWETQKAQWAFWIPVQLLNFQFVPVRHQLNVVLVTSVVWTALLSAWYPPEDVSGSTTETVAVNDAIFDGDSVNAQKTRIASD